MSITTDVETYVDTISQKTLFVWHTCTHNHEYIEYSLDEDGSIRHRDDGPAFIRHAYGDSTKSYWCEYSLYGVVYKPVEFVRHQEIVHLTLMQKGLGC